MTTNGAVAARPQVPWAWLLGIGVIPGILAMLQLGRLHPDEVYQYLEPANFHAFKYGVLAWEWQNANPLRNWAIPGIFGEMLKLCAWLGIDSPRSRRIVLELPQIALHVWMLWAVFQLARRRVNEDVARFAIAFVGLYMPVLTFAGRTLGESFSTAFLVIGLEWLDRDEGPRSSFLGGVTLGLSVVARYGSAAAVLGALLYLLSRRRWQAFALCVAGGFIVALMLGALDWVTWGAPFRSLRSYYEFNFASDKAARQFGKDSYTVYLPYLLMVAPWAWFGAIKRPNAVFIASSVTYLIAVFMAPHKEPRFLYPALVMLSVGAIGGALDWFSRRGIAWTVAASLLSLPFFLIDTTLKPQRGEQFRLEASVWPQATGLILVNEGIWGSGGFFWLGKNIPWFACDFPEQFAPAMSDLRFNRVISYDQRGEKELLSAGFRILEVRDHSTLYGR